MVISTIVVRVRSYIAYATASWTDLIYRLLTESSCVLFTLLINLVHYQ